MPYCIFEPTSAEDVAGALRIFVQTKTKFAVRSGGHMQVPNSSSITDGVLVALDRLNELRFLNPIRTAASLGCGNRWIDVYSWLAPFKLGILGGRYQPVGVSGLLLGGGISYFGSQHGWAADSVINYQVVLANSTIVDANATHNKDLWWALKGGSNNFGIVTRFDVKVYPLPSVYGGTTVYESEYLDDFLYAVSNYSSPQGGSADVLTSVNPSVEWNFTQGAPQLITIITRNSTDNNASAFANFSLIPKVSSDVSMRPDLLSLTNDTAATGAHARGLYFAKAIKATPEAVVIANKTFFEVIDANPSIKAAKGMLVAATYQTISQSWVQQAVASGGDAIDLEPSDGGLISFLGAMLWDNSSDDEQAYEFAYSMIETLTERVRQAKQDYPFTYINDAALDQPVYQYYGRGKSLPRMQAVAKAYDPHGVFQSLLPGGFKLSSVNQTEPVDLTE